MQPKRPHSALLSTPLRRDRDFELVQRIKDYVAELENMTIFNERDPAQFSAGYGSEKGYEGEEGRAEFLRKYSPDNFFGAKP